jgi:hypothetical protein
MSGTVVRILPEKPHHGRLLWYHQRHRRTATIGANLSLDWVAGRIERLAAWSLWARIAMQAGSLTTIFTKARPCASFYAAE